MRRLWFVVLLLFGACKSLKTDASMMTANSTSELLKSAESTSAPWNTLNFRGHVVAKTNDNRQRISTNIRVESQNQIWINASMIVPLGRAKIDTAGVAFYEVLGKSYFEGDFTAIQNLLGIALKYQALENGLLGRPLLPEMLPKARLSKRNGEYQLKVKQGKLEFVCTYGQDFLLRQQQVRIDKKQLIVSYADYQKTNDLRLPMGVIFDAQSPQNQASVSFHFRNVVVDAPLRFPFQIPKDFTPLSP